MFVRYAIIISDKELFSDSDPMEPREIVQHWITSARESWHTTQSLFDKEEYVSALFFAHLFLEKLLKGLIVQETGNHAPHGHTLGTLAKKAGLSLSPDQELFLERVTAYNIATRYEDWKFEFKKRCTREFCENEMKEIEGFGQWLQTLFKP